MRYFEELKKAMNYLAKDERIIFLGQAVRVEGTSMFNTLKEIDQKKLIELPVAEEMQMGMTNGFALNGQIPVSVFPRWNFVLLAMNQLVNHLDKIKLMSNDRYKTKAIIRTSVGSQRPLHPQHQHIGDFTDSVSKMCSNIEILRLEEPQDIFPAYKKALNREDGISTIVVEYGDYYNEK